MHPTTGGVLASWGSLGHVTWAEPHALIGFGGPRVVEMLTGAPLPDDVQRAERMLERGLLDDVVAPRGAARAGRPRAGGDRAGGPRRGGRPRTSAPAGGGRLRGDAWASVQHARDPARPSAGDLLGAWATDVTPLRGDRAGGGDDPACLAALARVRGIPSSSLVARSRGAGGWGPRGYRKARRAIGGRRASSACRC